MRRIAVVGAVALSSLTGCQSTLAPQAGATVADPAPSAQAEPLVPPDYRQTLAVALLGQYIRDADGPAEITPMRRGLSLLGPRPVLTVRFRLDPRRARGLYFHIRDGELRVRCITVFIDKSLLSGSRYFEFQQPRDDATGICDEGLPFAPFTELDAMAGKARACIARGESQCVVAEEGGSAKAESGKGAKLGR